MVSPPEIHTLAELLSSGHEQLTLREELRANLLAALAAGENPWPGMHGLDRTVIPQVEPALIAGSELNEHPYEPITAESRARAERDGDTLPVAWRHRSERYVEKLSTPDTSVADLIGNDGEAGDGDVREEQRLRGHDARQQRGQRAEYRDAQHQQRDAAADGAGERAGPGRARPGSGACGCTSRARSCRPRAGR